MSTTTQMQTATMTPSSSPPRKRFPKAVVNIIAPRRHASSEGLNTSTSTSTPKQRRIVSNPLVTEKAATEAEPEEQISQSATDTVKTSPGHHQLSFPHAAKLFVKLRRVQKKAKAHHIDSNSGDEPVTDRSLLSFNEEADSTKKLARLEIQDIYTCIYAVDVAKLLRASRAGLLDRARPLHANVLVDEQWSCSICGPKHRSDGSFRVHIRYAATAASSPKRDPRQPVELGKTSGVPGLMTISSRDTIGLNAVEL